MLMEARSLFMLLPMTMSRIPRVILEIGSPVA